MNNTDIPVNDGGGLLDNSGLIDSLIVDCNTLLQDIFGGSYIRFCHRLIDMVGRLSTLREGVNNERAQMQKAIDDLQTVVDDMYKRAEIVPPDEKGGE